MKTVVARIQGFINKLKSLVNIVSSKPPIIVIVGATGSGKSKLGIELAKVFGGEIINADSMQVYKGLDIITNKVTKEQQQIVSHHMLNVVSPLERFTVADFSNQALPIIDRLIGNGKIAFIIGGTYYYIESLLWKVLISDILNDKSLHFKKDKETQKNIKLPLDDDEIAKALSRSSANSPDDNSAFSVLLNEKISDDNITHELVNSNNYNTQDIISVTPDNLRNVSNDKLHQILKQIDSRMADILYVNDRRNILRSIQAYQKHGITYSEILDRQHTEIGIPLRYKNICIIYLHCDQEVLNERLDSRIDNMIKQGLIKEIQDFHEEYNKYRFSNNMFPDGKQGIFQSIGFKEFHEFLIYPDNQKDSEEGKKLFEKGLKEMKLVTGRYSRTQIKWIKKKFLRRKDRELPPVYKLDATCFSQWQENVLNPAINIINGYLKNYNPDINPLPIEKGNINVRESYFCEICQKKIVGSLVWEEHIKSRKHCKMKKIADQISSNYS